MMDVGFVDRRLLFALLLFLFLVGRVDGQDPPPPPPPADPVPPPPGADPGGGAPPPPPGGGGPGGGAPGGQPGNESAAAGSVGGTSTTEDPAKAKFDLECYQCIADGTELVPPCDSVFFTSLDSTELKELEFQCPKELPDFCVKKEIEYFKTGKKMTFRGCTGKVDELDNELRIGCIRIFDNLTVTEICFCNEKNCNLSDRFQSGPVLTVVCFIAIVLILMEIRTQVAIST